MKIKLAVLFKDEMYMGRIVSVFSTSYADKLQVYSFSKPDIAIETINNERIDILLCEEGIDIQPSSVPSKCSFVYFVDSKDIDSVGNYRAICKYQKAELIYKQILNIYSEKAESFSIKRGGEGKTKIVLFTSPVGGVGTSTIAAAFAYRFAHLGKKVLYLNLTPFDSPDFFFNGEGQYSMSDIIYAVKTKKNNLTFKLESSVRIDQSGVFFYSQPPLALDMLEMDTDNKQTLINEFLGSSLYDVIVIDNPFSLERNSFDFELMRQSYSITIVSDGSLSANLKTKRMIDSLITLEESNDIFITNRMFIFYNRFSSQSGQMIEDTTVKRLGGSPVYLNAQVHQLMDRLSCMTVFDELLK